MINNKKDLDFYIAADRIMNGFTERKTLKEYFANCFDRPVGGQLLAIYMHYGRILIIRTQLNINIHRECY